MATLVTPVRLIAATVLLLLVLLAVGWATRESPDDKPYLKIMGGGFVFNYRVADAFYGFTAAVIRPLPTGSVIEASFENPAGGEPFVVRQRVGTESIRYSLRTPPLQGIEADKPYAVKIRVLDRDDRKVLWAHERSYRSEIASEVMPEQPLTVGPGYARNPG